MTTLNEAFQLQVNNNYFNTIQTPFPSPTEEKIDTLQFLDASKGVVSLIDKFGKVFVAVKYDMNGNIEKLTKVYEQDKNNFQFLQDMIVHEHNEGGIIATDALLWLIRGLHLFQRFFELILNKGHTQNETECDDLSSLLTIAYEETLYHHHGWMAKQLFKLLSQNCPSETKLINVMSLDNKNASKDILYRDMAEFTALLKLNVDHITQFYKENNLDPSGV